MNYPSSETSSDLEWMLLSGQASKGELAEALLAEFYDQVYRLALYFLGNQQAASEAAPEVFIAALLTAYAYRSATGVRAWLFDLARKTCLEKRRKSRPGLPIIGSKDDKINLGSSLKPAPSDDDLRTWSTLDALEPLPRSLAFLHFGLGLKAPEIARIQHLKENEVETSLAAARGKLARPGSTLIQTSEDPVLYARVSQSLQRRFPSPELERHDLAKLGSNIALRAEQGDASRRKLASIKEFTLVGVIILVAIGLTWGINRYIPEPEPTSFPNSASLNVRVPTRTNVIYFVQRGDTLESVATRLGMTTEKLVAINAISTIDPLYSGEPLWVDITSNLPRDPITVTPLPPIEPLTSYSSSQAIQERLRQSASLWYTLWADIQNYPNGPTSTVGMNNLYRDQIWVRQPDQGMEVFGLPENQVFMRRIATGGRGYTIPGRSGEAYLDNDWSPHGQEVLRNPLLQALIFPGQSDWFRPGWNFKPVGIEITAGRPAVVVEWVNPEGRQEAQLWIDAFTGVILRRQSFHSNQPDEIISEMSITEIAYNVDIPERLFDPRTNWQGGFAQDYTGTPALK